MDEVRVLLFDVFGTLVDWRSSVTTYLIEAFHQTLNSSVASIPSTVRLAAADFTDEKWADFAQQWRNKYYRFTREYNPASQGDDFVSIDEQFKLSLMELLQEFGLSGLWDEEQVTRVSQIWRRLEPWPDSVRGMTLLQPKFEKLSTLSNGSKALLQDLVAYAQLPMTDILCAEDFRAYKPDPRVYDGAAERLGFPTRQCALVAAHLGDLEAAKNRGMRTIYIERRAEENWDEAKVHRAKQEGWVDIWIKLSEGNAKGENISTLELDVMSTAETATDGDTATRQGSVATKALEGGLVELVRQLDGAGKGKQ